MNKLIIVGAAVLAGSGKIYPGCNVENASYGLCNCAERTALFSAIAEGYQPGDFDQLVVVGETDGPIAPCGVEWQGRALPDGAWSWDAAQGVLRAKQDLPILLRDVEPGDPEEAGQVEHPRDLVAGVLVEPDPLEEEPSGRLGHRALDLEPDGVAEVALHQLALHGDSQVLDLLLVHEEVGIARDAELVAAADVHPGEELADVGVQDRGEEDEGVGRAGDRLRQLDNARQRARLLQSHRAYVQLQERHRAQEFPRHR